MNSANNVQLLSIQQEFQQLLDKTSFSDTADRQAWLETTKQMIAKWSPRPRFFHGPTNDSYESAIRAELKNLIVELKFRQQEAEPQQAPVEVPALSTKQRRRLRDEIRKFRRSVPNGLNKAEAWSRGARVVIDSRFPSSLEDFDKLANRMVASSPTPQREMRGFLKGIEANLGVDLGIEEGFARQAIGMLVTATVVALLVVAIAATWWDHPYWALGISVALIVILILAFLRIPWNRRLASSVIGVLFGGNMTPAVAASLDVEIADSQIIIAIGDIAASGYSITFGTLLVLLLLLPELAKRFREKG